MSIHEFIVAFDAVAIRFWEGSYFNVFDFESAWLMIVAFFSSTGPVLKARRTSTCRMLGKRERQETMVRCFCRPIPNYDFFKSAFLCPYFTLHVSYPPVFPLFPLCSPHRSCPALFGVIQCPQKCPWPGAWELVYESTHKIILSSLWKRCVHLLRKDGFQIQPFLFSLAGSKKCRDI